MSARRHAHTGADAPAGLPKIVVRRTVGAEQIGIVELEAETVFVDDARVIGVLARIGGHDEGLDYKIEILSRPHEGPAGLHAGHAEPTRDAFIMVGRCLDLIVVPARLGERADDDAWSEQPVLLPHHTAGDAAVIALERSGRRIVFA